MLYAIAHYATWSATILSHPIATLLLFAITASLSLLVSWDWGSTPWAAALGAAYCGGWLLLCAPRGLLVSCALPEVFGLICASALLHLAPSAPAAPALGPLRDGAATALAVAAVETGLLARALALREGAGSSDGGGGGWRLQPLRSSRSLRLRLRQALVFVLRGLAAARVAVSLLVEGLSGAPLACAMARPAAWIALASVVLALVLQLHFEPNVAAPLRALERAVAAARDARAGGAGPPLRGTGGGAVGAPCGGGALREADALLCAVGRLWALVRMGFGDAGAAVVSALAAAGGEGGGVAPALPAGLRGEKVHAVFGFCDIWNFAEHAERLQEDVLPFINDVARVVHEEVHASGGAPNRNAGDAFLCAWKLPTRPVGYGTGDDAPAAAAGRGAPRFSAAPLVAPLLALAQRGSSGALEGGGGGSGGSGGTHPPPGEGRPPQVPPLRLPVLARSTAASAGFFEGPFYDGPPPSLATLPARAPAAGLAPLRQLPGVLVLATNALAACVNAAVRLQGGAREGCSLSAHLERGGDGGGGGGGGHPLRLGFGLHLGWAVEGAIGSPLKLDASYLSPAVNVASRLENACRAYGADVVLSRTFLLCLPVDVVHLLRRVDRVRMKGVPQPVELYTLDWDARAAMEVLDGAGAEGGADAGGSGGDGPPSIAGWRGGDVVRYQPPPAAAAVAAAAAPRALPRSGGARAWATAAEQLADLHRLQPLTAFPRAFVEHSQRAVECYLGDAGAGGGEGAGVPPSSPAPNWPLAKRHAELALALRPGDGPLRALLRTLEELGEVGEGGAWGAPKGWPGFRDMGKAP